MSTELFEYLRESEAEGICVEVFDFEDYLVKYCH